MQLQDINKQDEFKVKPLTEQLIFLLNGIPQIRESPVVKARKNFGIIGSVLADLFMMKRVGLLNNKITVLKREQTNLNYINNIINELESLEKDKMMEDIIHALRPLGDEINKDLKQDLIDNNWLHEKKGFFSFLTSNNLQVENEKVVRLLKTRLQKILQFEQEPDKKEIFLLAVMEAIGALRPFLGIQEPLEDKQERLEEIFNQEYLAKMIYDAIKNQPDPKSFQEIDVGPPMYMAGIGGLMRR